MAASGPTEQRAARWAHAPVTRGSPVPGVRTDIGDNLTRDGEIGRRVQVGDSTCDQAMAVAFVPSAGRATRRDVAAPLHAWSASTAAGARVAGVAERDEAGSAAR